MSGNVYAVLHPRPPFLRGWAQNCVTALFETRLGQGLPYGCHLLAKIQNFNFLFLELKVIFKGFYALKSLI